METVLLAGLNSGVIGSAGAAVGIGSAISSVAGFIGPAFGLLSTIGGAAMQAQSGKMQAQQYKLQAQQSTINARIEKVNAEEKANEIRRNLMANLGSANATFAARGIGIGSGTPEQARTESAKNASLNIEKARFGGTMASNEKLLQASQDRINASSAKSSGYSAGLTSLAGSKSIRSLLEF
jgi:hypothetical protein